MLTGAQIRMARGYLNWPVKDMAEKSGVGISTIQRMESYDGVPPCLASNIESVRETLEAEGILFIPGDNINGPGVRLKGRG